MKSELLNRVERRTPEATKIFVRKISDLHLLLHETLEEKEMKQKELARLMGKQPSQVSRWLNGEGTGNLTLRTIAELEAVLGRELLRVPTSRPLVVEMQCSVTREYRRYDRSIKPSLNTSEFTKVGEEIMEGIKLERSVA